MSDDDMIRRGDAVSAAANLYKWSVAAGEELEAAIRAIPAADARPVQDDAASRRRKIMGYMDDKAAADARALYDALKNARVGEAYISDADDGLDCVTLDGIFNLEAKTCPPCHGDCNQGRTCPARKK